MQTAIVIIIVSVVSLALFVINPGLVLFALILIFGILVYKRNEEIAYRVNDTARDALHITNVDVGGVFKLTGVDTVNDYTPKVIGKHLYKEGDYYWYELECDKGDGEKIWVDVDDDDQTVVSVVLKKMKLTDIPVTPAQLDKFDYDESGSLKYDGKTYRYMESANAVFYRNSDDEKVEKLYYWDFRTGSSIISIEKWGETYEVYLSQSMRPNQITVYSIK